MPVHNYCVKLNLFYFDYFFKTNKSGFASHDITQGVARDYVSDAVKKDTVELSVMLLNHLRKTLLNFADDSTEAHLETSQIF